MDDSARFAYIIGRIRAIETKMLNQTLLERMIDAKNADEAFRVLNDHPLISDYIGNFTAKDYQKVFTDSIKGVKDFLDKNFPYKEYINFLWNKYDFHNLKIVLKAKLMNHGYADIEHALIDLGSYSVSLWEDILFNDGSLEIIPSASYAVRKAVSAYEKTKDPQVVDLIIDQCYLDEMHRLANKIDSPLTTSYVTRLIDITNVRTFIRSKELKKDRAYFENALTKGGSVYLTDFLNAYDKGYDELRIILESHIHMADLSIGLDNVKKEKSLFMFEIKMVENLQSFIHSSRLISFGPEPVFAFFYKFENQLQILRTILVGKLNKLEVKEIASSLPAL